MTLSPQARARREARRNQLTDPPTNQPSKESTVAPTTTPTEQPTTVGADEPMTREQIRAGLADGSITLEPLTYDADGEVVEGITDHGNGVSSVVLTDGRIEGTLIGPTDRLAEVVRREAVVRPARDDDPVHPDAPVLDDAAAAGRAMAAERAARGGRPRPPRHGHGLLDVEGFGTLMGEVAGRARARGGVSPVNVAVSTLLADRLDAYVSAHRVATGSRLSKREVVEALLDELLGDGR